MREAGDKQEVRVGAAFAALLASFLGLTIAGALLLSRLGHDTAQITDVATTSIELLSQTDGLSHTLMARAAEYAHASVERRAEIDHLLAAADARYQALAAQYAPLAAHSPDEARAWESSDRAWLAFRQEVSRAVAAFGQTEPEGRRERLKRIAERKAELNALVSRLILLNAEEARSAGRQIHGSLILMAEVGMAFTAAASVAAVVLFLFALQAIHRHAVTLREQAAELDAFASRVAHDLRGPLTTVGLLTDTALRQIGDERIAGMLARSRRNLHQLGDMIKDLLEFARSGGRPEPGAHVVVEQVVVDLLGEMASRLSAASITLRVDMDSDLEVAVAPTPLRVIASNLVENSLKFVRDEGEKRIEVRAKPKNRGTVILVVRDTGPGIAPSALPQVFAPFRRGAEQPGGYGLGLATVKRLVDAHGGRIAIQSEVGRGTTVEVELPRWLTGPPRGG